MLRPIAVPETYFDTERSKLRGMNETSCKIKVKPEYAGDNKSLKQRVYETANVALVPTLDQGNLEVHKLRYCAGTRLTIFPFNTLILIFLLPYDFR